MARSRKIRLAGGTIYARGSRLFAHVPLDWGRGRKRRTAPNTPEGLAKLQEWVALEVSAAATNARPLTPGEVADARAALEGLPEGMSLVEAVRIARESTTVRERRTIADAAAEYLAFSRRAGRRAETLITVAGNLRKLSPWARKDVATFPVDLAAKVVQGGKAATTQNTIRSCCSAFWTWCVRMGYAVKNPFAAVPRAKADEKIPEIYTPEEVARLFAAAEKGKAFRRCIPFLAVAFFAGIRSSGILRLSRDAFDLRAGTFAIPPRADKERRGYYAPVTPTLRAWLEAYPPRKRIAPFCQKTWYDLRAKLHAKAKVPLRANAARHSFASYSVAAGGDPQKVALAMGHFRDTTVLFNHYRALATPAAAQAYFAILPKGKK